ncbi:winged helix-turn-helix domain-containing protein [Methanolobus halotolerans]|uniref:ArsR family transcriptional regulator n=1 Tax=Methanolobus halotolerans TaxID=2052935 RepID=A0A4E0Q402_9EURY|nr:winged helix-turn-helix domain-containing protein [Methanolobus halotolerans]TGC08441.1 ArsR family transcriptional regulator [Methanolobus halotolerans]
MAGEDPTKRKHEWMSKLEKEGRLKANPTEDHAIGLRTLQNPTRRKILKMLNGCSLCIEEIGKKLNLSDSQAKFHVDMLENALYIDRIDNSEPTMYQLSPRGEGFLQNVEEVK